MREAEFESRSPMALRDFLLNGGETSRSFFH